MTHGSSPASCVPRDRPRFEVDATLFNATATHSLPLATPAHDSRGRVRGDRGRARNLFAREVAPIRPGGGEAVRSMPKVRRRRSERHRRGDRKQAAVLGFHQLPTSFMELVVVAQAQQDLVLDLAATGMDPVHQMMAVAPGSRSLTAWPTAVPIACDQSARRRVSREA